MLYQSIHLEDANLGDKMISENIFSNFISLSFSPLRMFRLLDFQEGKEKFVPHI